MKKVTLTSEQASFLYSILNNPKLTPMQDIKLIRKVNKVFDAIEDMVENLDDQKKALRDKYKESKVIKDDKGSENETFVIPERAVEEYEEELKLLGQESVEVIFDRNAWETVKDLFTKVVENAYNEKSKESDKPVGIGGRYNIKMFAEVSEALEDATRALEDATSPKKEK